MIGDYLRSYRRRSSMNSSSLYGQSSEIFTIHANKGFIKLDSEILQFYHWKWKVTLFLKYLHNQTISVFLQLNAYEKYSLHNFGRQYEIWQATGNLTGEHDRSLDMTHVSDMLEDAVLNSWITEVVNAMRYGSKGVNEHISRQYVINQQTYLVVTPTKVMPKSTEK